MKTITARPCGHYRDGSPISPREYTITREPEPFDPEPGDPTYAAWDGHHRSRLWGKCEVSAKHGLDREAPLAVVFTNTIQAVAS